jgi:hypothetical protein
MLRGLLDDGLIVRTETRYQITVDAAEITRSRLPMPASLRQALAERLQPLGPDAREVGRTLALARRRVDLDVVLAASRLPEARVMEALDALVEREIVTETRTDDDDVVELSHGRFREVLLEGGGSRRPVGGAPAPGRGPRAPPPPRARRRLRGPGVALRARRAPVQGVRVPRPRRPAAPPARPVRGIHPVPRAGPRPRARRPPVAVAGRRRSPPHRGPPGAVAGAPRARRGPPPRSSTSPWRAARRRPWGIRSSWPRWRPSSARSSARPGAETTRRRSSPPPWSRPSSPGTRRCCAPRCTSSGRSPGRAATSPPPRCSGSGRCRSPSRRATSGVRPGASTGSRSSRCRVASSSTPASGSSRRPPRSSASACCRRSW